MRARPWLVAATGLAGAAVATWGWSRHEPQGRVASPRTCTASADSSPGCLNAGVARETGFGAKPVLAEGLGASSPSVVRVLPEAPEPVRAVVARFRLEDEAAEYEHLSDPELTVRMDDLRTRRQSLEAETERLNGQHYEALSAGDRARVEELRRAISRAVQERTRLAAALLVAGYVRGSSTSEFVEVNDHVPQ